MEKKNNLERKKKEKAPGIQAEAQLPSPPACSFSFPPARGPGNLPRPSRPEAQLLPLPAQRTERSSQARSAPLPAFFPHRQLRPTSQLSPISLPSSLRAVAEPDSVVLPCVEGNNPVSSGISWIERPYNVPNSPRGHVSSTEHFF